jgi:hypothetical protein
VQGRYASYWNVAHAGSGHAWQGRFYSCPLDAGHSRVALRCAELNPVEAGLVAGPIGVCVKTGPRALLRRSMSAESVDSKGRRS